jgi:hypothetical protein
MQFIPSTWAHYATDGNGDGVSDPFNIYDAAAAAGKYLCNAGGDLRTRAGKIRAVLTYNHSDAYVASVLALEATYAGAPITAQPAFVTPVLSAPLPPVNPGVPTAIHPRVLTPATSAPKAPAPSRSAPTPVAPITTPTPVAPTTTPTPVAPTTTPPTPACATAAAPLVDAPSGTLTDTQKAALAAMAEEQQLAHDLYLAFADKYGPSVFGCMSNNQATQLTGTRQLVQLYKVVDPTAAQPAVGTFSTASTQQLYDTLMAQGATSVDNAYAAARKLESMRITDLEAAVADLTPPASPPSPSPDALQLYTNLLAASRSQLLALGG